MEYNLTREKRPLININRGFYFLVRSILFSLCTINELFETLLVRKTFAPMVELSPIMVSPPKIVAFA